jgi:hypothetical protein
MGASLILPSFIWIFLLDFYTDLIVRTQKLKVFFMAFMGFAVCEVLVIQFPPRTDYY